MSKGKKLVISLLCPFLLFVSMNRRVNECAYKFLHNTVVSLYGCKVFTNWENLYEALSSCSGNYILFVVMSAVVFLSVFRKLSNMLLTSCSSSASFCKSRHSKLTLASSR